jgi:hemerythrin superfamily protein
MPKKNIRKYKDYIAKLNRLSIESEKWVEQFREFKHSVTHHVKEEEKDIFEEAKKVLSKEAAKQLAVDMETIKQGLKPAA